MSGKSQAHLLKTKISDCRMILYELQTFIKFGALSCDSGIIDKELQLNKGEDYYILLRAMNKRIKKAIDILQD